jgi:biotin transport system substrate-specific component
MGTIEENAMRHAIAQTLQIDGLRFRRAGLILLGTAILTLSSYIQVPMFPVPMTMQTLAVTMLGAAFGWRLGTATVLAWLAEAMIGLPVLAGGSSGLALFVGPTAGYIFAFPLMAALTGWLAEHGWKRHLALAFIAMLLGNALCLASGAAWLAGMIGPAKAFSLGVTPFVLGGIVKSAIGAVGLRLLAR